MSRPPRDVLIVFGARVGPDGEPGPALRRRLEAAVETGRRAHEPLYIVSGAGEAEVMARVLLRRGVPPGAILAEPLSRDTLEQARRCAAILDGLPGGAAGRRVVVCTSGFHQPRCRLLLRMLGVRSRGARVPGERAALGCRTWLRLAARECAAVLWDASLLAVLVLAGRGRLRS